MIDIDHQPEFELPETIETISSGEPAARSAGVSDALAPEVQHPLWQRTAKRSADLLVVVVLAPLVVVLMAVAAALVVIVDRQRPFFIDPRVGRGGRRFGCYKLRTMRNDDDSFAVYLHQHPAESLFWADSRKVENDPRVTRLGAALRHSSIDELPQFLNVLIGDMSLVGPRPLSEREFGARAEGSQRLLGQVRPGLTGPWQVAGRSDVSIDERIALDDGYARDWSLRGDLLIVLKTPVAVLAGAGAK